MHAVNSETLLAEIYGSSLKKRLYNKPLDQSKLILLEDEKLSSMAGAFTSMFLPQGYPDSVSKDYFAYQMWDMAQAFCSTITGTLATKEIFKSVGVGSDMATPLAATITWVFKDGCGHIGKIIFSYTYGTYLDAYSKKWRLYADILNDAAMCIEISLSLFGDYSRYALFLSTVMKAIVSVAGGATSAALTQHHAIRGNLADVSMKDAAQETAVNLFASFAALLIVTFFGNSLSIFMLMTIFHILFNYYAVKSVCLRTLNEPRFLLVIDNYLRKETILNPYKINKEEPIMSYQLESSIQDFKLCGFEIKMGQSIENIIKVTSKASQMRELKKIYKDAPYILYSHSEIRTIFVFIKDGSSTSDILRAYFHAVVLGIIICSINDEELEIFVEKTTDNPFGLICDAMQSAAWSSATDENKILDFEPPSELLEYVLSIATEEWKCVQEGLVQTGWDISKHFLVLDEWRVCSDEDSTLPLQKDIQRKQSSVGFEFLEEISSSTSRRLVEAAREALARREENESNTIEPEPTASKTVVKKKSQEKIKASKLKMRLRKD